MFDDIPRPTCRSVYTSKESEALPLVNPFGDPYQNLDKPAPAPVAKKPGYDSLDYDICYNVPYKRMLRKYTKYTYWHTAIMRWVVVGMIGFLTGLVAFLLDFGMSALLRSKFSVFNQDTTCGKGWHSVLKGNGVLFSVSAGFFVGQEGPMVYIGSVIGAGLPQLRSLLPCVKKFVFLIHTSDWTGGEKRDFASSGAAAGVASAFGAPIGGTLFSLEEGSSFWNQGLTWRTLFCSFCATFTFNILLSATASSEGFNSRPGQVNFGSFQGIAGHWKYYHLVIFAAIGAGGGLLGALFNSLSKRITRHRMSYLQKRKGARVFWRVLEAVLVITTTTLLVFICGAALSTCVDHTPASVASSDTEAKMFELERNSYFCPSADDYNRTGQDYVNDVTTILFNSQEVATQLLFHLEVFVLYFCVSCWTLGTAISSGLFIPCIVTGALTYNIPVLSAAFREVYTGTYALIGAASFLAGVMRMTLSLTVIMVEATQQVTYGVPIMVSVMVAKWVGDYSMKAIYDISIRLKKIPYIGVGNHQNKWIGYLLRM
eukprot:Em0225g5a